MPDPGVPNSPPHSASQLLLYVWARLLGNFATEHRSAAKTIVFFSDFLVFENFHSRCRFVGLPGGKRSIGGRPGLVPGTGPASERPTLFEPLLAPYRGKPLLGKKGVRYKCPTDRLSSTIASGVSEGLLQHHHCAAEFNQGTATQNWTHACIYKDRSM